ncbi:MAG: tetraacyldisaccharide 4'-kinase [Saprospiraceae bacterium]
MNWIGKILMFPFALIYGLLVSMRNALYDSSLLRSTSFDLPVISVGNIKVGGTGKTPTVEWLIQILAPFLDVAVLSRGFSRKTRGYHLVSTTDNTYTVGDEALQIKRKFPSVSVAVSESRSFGISSLLMDHPTTQVVILDDAFQHRSIAPSLSIVLTEYHNPYFKDYLMPVGKLREWRTAIERADYLIVSKCSLGLSQIDADNFKNKIGEIQRENIYFSRISYGPCYSMFDFSRQLKVTPESAVQIISGIAEPEYLKDHFKGSVDRVYSYDFPDHHPYETTDIENIIASFSRIPYDKKALITTEKDIVKLINHTHLFQKAGVEVFIQRISVEIIFNQHEELSQKIKDFLINFVR